MGDVTMTEVTTNGVARNGVTALKGIEPIAVIGMGCRLPGNCNNPTEFWRFLREGNVASNQVPSSRCDMKTHYTGVKRRAPMRSPGAMCLDGVDIGCFDAGFFGISRAEATSMDPQQRQLLEVVYEGLENAGIPMEAISGTQTGCFVATFTVDYEDMQMRDPENRPPNTITGIGRAILSNRISHAFDLRGPSMSIDTGCSGSLVAFDTACRYLNSGESNMAIVAAANLFLSPERLMNEGSLAFIHSPTALCHTFDLKADGYVRAEGVNCVILKRLSDALHDQDPIRAVIRGWATNSDGKTLGISTPDANAQAECIKAAYRIAGIDDLGATSYVECHGTGTPTGDATELKGLSLAFRDSLNNVNPLAVGSVKSNIGHSEPSAGISGLMKAILSIENGYIPGNPTFISPHPELDFEKLKMKPSRMGNPWPVVPFRRASVNSFGYGGSNSHVVLDEPGRHSSAGKGDTFVSSYFKSMDDIFADDDEDDDEYKNNMLRPYILTVSGADEYALDGNCDRMIRHLSDFQVKIQLRDLAHSLNTRRTHFANRAYWISSNTKLSENSFTKGKPDLVSPRIGFVFTGQGAQWAPTLGADLVRTFPLASNVLKGLNEVLQSLSMPPPWSLYDKFTETVDVTAPDEPALSQPLLTALQIILVCLLESWGIQPERVVGHSGGEVGAAFTAGHLTKEEAIILAYYRGYATENCPYDLETIYGMLSVGLGPDQVQPYLLGHEGSVEVACLNSPDSVTLSGTITSLQCTSHRLNEAKHFARLLKVNKAYHSRFIEPTANMFSDLVRSSPPVTKEKKRSVSMFSTVTGTKIESIDHDIHWKNNMLHPVQFSKACADMISGDDASTLLIEIGPSGALRSPVAQIIKGIQLIDYQVKYASALVKGSDPISGLFDLAGSLYLAGHSINLAEINRDDGAPPCHIVDLPNYSWNHSTSYWHENSSSNDWRLRKFPHHELLGSKVLGTSWDRPSWKRTFRTQEIEWLRDHQIGGTIIFPGAGYITMAIEALRQMKSVSNSYLPKPQEPDTHFQFRNVSFLKALALDDNKSFDIMLTMQPQEGTQWHSFQISSFSASYSSIHCTGLISSGSSEPQVCDDQNLKELNHPQAGEMWYKTLCEIGYGYGPTFQKMISVESLAGSLEARSRVSLTGPDVVSDESWVPIHPCALDGALHTILPAVWRGDRNNPSQLLVPISVDSLNIYLTDPSELTTGISISSVEYIGRGRPDDVKSYTGSCSVYNEATGRLVLRVQGLQQSAISAKAEAMDAVNFHNLAWKPDITFIDQPIHLTPSTSVNQIQEVIDLIAHKRSPSTIIEIHYGDTKHNSVWLADHVSSYRRNFQSCVVYHSVEENLTSAREALPQSRIELHKLDSQNPKIRVPDQLDLGIIYIGENEGPKNLDSLLDEVSSRTSYGGFLLLVEQIPLCKDHQSCLTDSEMRESIQNSGFTWSEIPFSPGQDVMAVVCRRPVPEKNFVTSKDVAIVSFLPSDNLSDEMKGKFQMSGYNITEYFLPFSNIPDDVPLIVLDELRTPILVDPKEEHWEGLKILIKSNRNILWVTCGSQLQITTPDSSMVHGLFRTIRVEHPFCSLLTLDVESSTSDLSIRPILSVLQQLQSLPSEFPSDTEFAERGGTIYVSRVVPHRTLSESPTGTYMGKTACIDFHNDNQDIGLQCNTVGSLDSLAYVERANIDPVENDHVEVEIHAVGMNFKDVAIVMGIVYENEYNLGSEGAGIIRRVGKNVEGYEPGDRVMLAYSGCLGNRVQVPWQRICRIPTNMSFEEAATMPVCFCTALYSMITIGNLKENQSVLIHSATGGLGLSCIQVAKMIGAEIYATVGTEEKKKHLAQNHGIPLDHIYSSRDVSFAHAINTQTNGKGIDLVLNTLVGDLLDASWRICADGGTFVELGKKDIRDRRSISMEPFDRNCSFRAVDLSYKEITLQAMERLFRKMSDLIGEGHIKPIHPVALFSFSDPQAAFRYLAKASHIGKAVLTIGDEKYCRVPVKPAKNEIQLRANASYLVVGGLKGICGRLAMSLAKYGAKTIVAMSRSGCNDARSQLVVANLKNMGCSVIDVVGDVCCREDVHRAVTSALTPLAGIIHGAMNPVTTTFGETSRHDYIETVGPKVTGAWNLHDITVDLGLNLDFFTMLSSLSGVIGLQGLASYAAANHFLDAFAQYRHGLGLSANSIALSLVGDIGYMTKSSLVKNRLSQNDLIFLKEKQLDEILSESIIVQTEKQYEMRVPQLITGLRDPLAATSELAPKDPRFTTIVTAEGAQQHQEENTDPIVKLVNYIRGSHSTAKRGSLIASTVEAFNLKLTQVLQTEEPLDPAKSLAAYGLDSLTAIQFRNWVQETLSVAMSTVDVTSASSLYALAETSIDRLLEAANKVPD